MGRRSNPGRFRIVLIRTLHCNPTHAKLELPESLSVSASSPRIRTTCELSTPDKLVYVTVVSRERDSIGASRCTRGGSSKTGKDSPCLYRELHGISGNSFPVLNGPEYRSPNNTVILKARQERCSYPPRPHQNDFFSLLLSKVAAARG